jgi:hypothetical protein
MTLIEATAFVMLVSWLVLASRRAFGQWQARSETTGSRTQNWLEQINTVGPIEVAGSRWNSTGDRCTLDLADHGTLRIHCFWPRPMPIVAIRRASYRRHVGWCIVMQAPNGDPTTVWVWAAEHHPSGR